LFSRFFGIDLLSTNKVQEVGAIWLRKKAMQCISHGLWKPNCLKKFISLISFFT